ncbi:MAG: hypothetical protein V1918_08065, partial [Planctomycetota bacterium]
MRNAILIILLGLLMGAAASWATRHYALTPGTPDRNWSNYRYRIFEKPCDGDFDATVRVIRSVEKSMPPASFRILFQYEDPKNYLAITVADQGVDLLRVEGGAAMSLAKCPAPPALAPGEEGTFRLQWRQPSLALLYNGGLLISADLRGERTGAVGIGEAPGGALAVGPPQVQPVAPLVFTDDFMRASDDTSEWEPAGPEWEVRSINNPARSSNAFVYQCLAPQGSSAFAGRDYWDAYRAGVAVNGAENGAVGLFFHARDAQNGFLFRWASQPAMSHGGRKPETVSSAGGAPALGDAGANPPPWPENVLELVRLRRGEETVLMERPGGYRPGQWYRMEVVAGEGHTQCLIDGHAIFTLDDPEIWGGRVGLFARGETGAEFDDFEVESHPGSFGPRAAASAPGNGPVAFFGRLSLRAYVFRAALTFPLQPSPKSNVPAVATLYAAYRDPFHYLAYEVAGPVDARFSHRLLQVDGDPERPRVLSEEEPLSPSAAGPGGASFLAEVRLDQGVVSARAGDSPPLYAHVGPEASGPAGMRMAGPVSCGNAMLTPLQAALPVAALSEIFDEEQLMAAWSGTAGDWEKNDPKKRGYTEWYEHRAPFYGDTEIEALLPEAAPAGDSAENPRELALSIANQGALEDEVSGYVLRYLPPAEVGGRLILLRKGEEVRSVARPKGAEARRLRLGQSGPFVMVHVDDQEALAWRDPEPLAGERVSWGMRGLLVKPEDVMVYNKGLRSYFFNSAPVDWRVGAGVWEVTNRWECDPRWSFWAGMPGRLAMLRAAFLAKKTGPEDSWKAESLRSQCARLADPEDKHVVLWHKGSFSGDLMV